MSSVDVVIGTLVIRKASFALNKFLENQKEIQDDYPDSELIIATDEPDFITELREKLETYGIKGSIIEYVTEKPDYAESRIWSITSGRNALREYILKKSEARFLLFIDSDMICDPDVISILEKQIDGDYSVVHSGYLLRHFGVCLIGLGCSMIKKDILRKISFRCIEFENHEVIDEGTLFEMDLVNFHGRIKKGIFLRIDHFTDEDNAISIEPGKISIFRKITTHLYIRYVLTNVSIMTRHDVSGKLQTFLHGFLRYS